MRDSQHQVNMGAGGLHHLLELRQGCVPVQMPASLTAHARGRQSSASDPKLAIFTSSLSADRSACQGRWTAVTRCWVGQPPSMHCCSIAASLMKEQLNP